MAAMKKCSVRSMAFAGVLMRMVTNYLALGVAVKSDAQEGVGHTCFRKPLVVSCEENRGVG